MAGPSATERGAVATRAGEMAAWAMLDALGSVWLTDTLAYKPYPGCAYLQSSGDPLTTA